MIQAVIIGCTRCSVTMDDKKFCEQHGVERTKRQDRLRCIECEKQRMKEYRKRFPEKVVWHSLLKQVRRKTGVKLLLQWKTHGEKLLSRFPDVRKWSGSYLAWRPFSNNQP